MHNQIIFMVFKWKKKIRRMKKTYTSNNMANAMNSIRIGWNIWMKCQEVHDKIFKECIIIMYLQAFRYFSMLVVIDLMSFDYDMINVT